MNNIRKIIAEKIANLKDKRVNDYADGFNDGLFEAFKIFLEELPAPKRTEQEILKDFEKSGYEVVCNSDRELILERNYREWIDRIRIDKIIKLYAKSQCFIKQKDIYTQSIYMQEHKLLNELFEVIFDE